MLSFLLYIALGLTSAYSPAGLAVRQSRATTAKMVSLLSRHGPRPTATQELPHTARGHGAAPLTPGPLPRSPQAATCDPSALVEEPWHATCQTSNVPNLNKLS